MYGIIAKNPEKDQLKFRRAKLSELKEIFGQGPQLENETVLIVEHPTQEGNDNFELENFVNGFNEQTDQPIQSTEMRETVQSFITKSKNSRIEKTPLIVEVKARDVLKKQATSLRLISREQSLSFNNTTGEKYRKRIFDEEGVWVDTASFLYDEKFNELSAPSLEELHKNFSSNIDFSEEANCFWPRAR